MLHFPVAVLASLAFVTFAQSGVYTDTVCSCTEFSSSSSTKCVKTSSPGKCTLEDCAAGYRCDMAGTTLCKRVQCTVMKSISLGVGTSTIDIAPGTEFACEETEVPCAHVAPEENLLVPTPPPVGCHFTDTECSCSGDIASEGKCVRLNVLATDETSAKCSMGACTSGYQCNCMGTELCDRVPCSTWAVSKDNPSGPLEPGFNCEQVDNTCVHKQ